jgi:hypothetical protein
MQNTVYECKQNGEDFFSSLTVTCFCFGNRPANGLVTEQPQYSVVVCIFHILQNTEIQLISNDLRLIFTYSLLLASPCIFHTSRHTFASTVTLANNISLEVVSKMLGHTNTRMTNHYAKLIDKCIGEQMDKLMDTFTGDSNY